MNTSHQIFFNKINEFQKEIKSSIQKEVKGKSLTDEFLELISKNLKEGNILETNPLYPHLTNINIMLESFILSVKKEWNNLTFSEELSKDFGDKLIFFVFGKVNAGKSSFSNLFTRLSEKNIEIFYLDENNDVQSSQDASFKVGQTETTARIQWVELGSLVLVDSPGLHSITEKNAELTKKYLDSADGIIWLTSSGSPGQVQELEELAKEMRKEKPILPVITKSDFYEEDWCDEKEDVVRVLKSKDTETRTVQENDVKKRAEELLLKLNSNAKLLTPISISSLCAEKQMMTESNIEKLFEVLNRDILENAISYKSEKPKKLLLNYFELEIIEKVDNKLLPNIQTLKKSIEEQKNKLKKQKKSLQKILISDSKIKISTLVKKYEDSKNTKNLAIEINQYIEQRFNKEVSTLLKSLFANIQQTSIELNSESIADYEDVSFTYEIDGRKRGFLDKAWSTITLEFDYRDRESSSTRTEVIGVDSSAVINSIQKSVQGEILKNIEVIFSEFNQTFKNILSNISKIENDIDLFKNKIEELKNEN